MARYIDADKLKRHIVEDPYRMIDDVVYADDIDNAPTVDAVEVVRCKDCRHSETCPDMVLWCNENNRLIYGEAFCSYGERKEQA